MRPKSIVQFEWLYLAAILAVAQFVLSVLILYLLFRPDAKAWFAGAPA